MVQHKNYSPLLCVLGNRLPLLLVLLFGLSTSHLVDADCTSVTSCWTLKDNASCTRQYGCNWSTDILRTDFGTSYIKTCENPSWKEDCSSFDSQSSCQTESSCRWSNEGGTSTSAASGGSKDSKSGRSGAANFFFALFIIALIGGVGIGMTYLLWKKRQVGPWPQIHQWYTRIFKKETVAQAVDEEAPASGSGSAGYLVSSGKTETDGKKQNAEIEMNGGQGAKTEALPGNPSSIKTVTKTYGADGSITITTKTVSPNGLTQENTQIFPDKETAIRHGVQVE